MLRICGVRCAFTALIGAVARYKGKAKTVLRMCLRRLAEPRVRHASIEGKDHPMTNVSRRDFLKFAGGGAAASALNCGCTSRASTVVLLPDRVAYVCGCKPDVHNPGGGGDAALFIGNYCKNSERFLLHWDLTDVSPKRAITKAVMGLYCAEIYGTPSGRLVYAPLKSDWGDAVTYASQPEHETAGQVSMAWPTKGKWHEVDVTGIVTQWLASPNLNHGLIGCAVDVTEETCSAVFASIRAPVETRPKLTLT